MLSPHAVQADQIARLSWTLFAVALVILLIVAAATWIAILGPAKIRGALATPRMVVIGGIVFPAIVLCVLLVSNISLLHAFREPADKPDTVSIRVVGEQWWWRVTYNAHGIEVSAANEIRIPVGRDIVFTLTSADVIHSFWVPSLGGKVDMIPGRDTRLRVHATRPGIFRGPCAEYCGGPHALMASQVIALPLDAFETWLANEAKPATAPVNEKERQGQEIFLSSGCGACHAVRGTPAQGIVGPNLTRLATRTAIGAGTLPLTSGNLARFISDGQSVKPGNGMPEFRIFTDGQRDALTAYLLSLK
ncbi:MAG: cytochrome c oxidase subunit II [Gammaproteobacteria bacterium]